MCFGLTLIKKSELESIENIKKELVILKEEVARLINENISLKKNQELKEPIALGTITYKSLWDLILKEVGITPYLSDEYYSLTDIKQASEFSDESHIQYQKWIKEAYDCDEFSFASMGYWNQGLKQFAYGIAWSQSHAFNIFIDNENKIWIVEPQSNKYISLEEAKNNALYFPIRLVLI